MRKKVGLLFTFIALFLGINVNAASSCSYEEQANLLSEVGNIKVSYEEKTGKIDSTDAVCPDEIDGTPTCDSNYEYFEVSILNMSDNFYLTVENNLDKTTKTYTYDDVKDGIITFKHEDIMNLTTYTYQVYSSEKTNCPRENYRTIYQTLPRLNEYYSYAQCSNNEDYYLCQKYVTFEPMSLGTFIKNINDYNTSEDNPNNPNRKKSFIDNIKNFISENKVIVLTIAGVIVIAGGTAAFVAIKRRKRSAL